MLFALFIFISIVGIGTGFILLLPEDTNCDYITDYNCDYITDYNIIKQHRKNISNKRKSNCIPLRKRAMLNNAIKYNYYSLHEGRAKYKTMRLLKTKII